MLMLSDVFVLLKELTISPRAALTPTCASWRGDGEYLSVISTDSVDSVSRVRLYTRNLEFVTMGRNSMGGEMSVMKGLGGVTAYDATNGSYVAVTQQRIKGKHQVIFLDGSGLTVDTFDIQTPALPVGFEEWQVNHLEWDLNSALIAVCFHAVQQHETKNDTQWNLGSCIDSDSDPSIVVVKAEDGSATIASSARKTVPSYVHLYFRNTYYWYLKQQWEGDSLRFLGFDTQVVNRLYLSQVMSTVVTEGGAEKIVTPAVRIVDIVWEITNSLSSSAISDATSENLKLEKLELKRETSQAVNGLIIGGSEAELRESEWALHLKKQKLGLEEKAQRCRDRNRIDARNTRNRKRQQMEELQLRIQELTQEKTRLYEALPEQNSDVASILMMLSGNNSSSSSAAAADCSSSSGGINAGDDDVASSSSSLSGTGTKRGFDSISAIVAAAGVDLDDDDEGDDGNEGDEGEGESINGDGKDGLGPLPATGQFLRGKGKPANAKQLAEERRKERNRIHAQKARVRKKTMLAEMLATISSLEDDIRKIKMQKAERTPAPIMAE